MYQGSGTEICLYYFLAVWFWANYLNSLSLSFPIYKMGVELITAMPYGVVKFKWDDASEVLAHGLAHSELFLSPGYYRIPGINLA